MSPAAAYDTAEQVGLSDVSPSGAHCETKKVDWTWRWEEEDVRITAKETAAANIE